MKLWVVFATWLSGNIVIALSHNTVIFTTHLASVGSYQTSMSSLRTDLQSRDTSHGIPVLPKSSEITNATKFLLVQLINYDSQHSITLAVYALNVYVIAYRSEGRSFFLKDAPAESEELLFNGTQQTRLSVETNYAKLGDRSKIPLGITPLKTAIDTMHNFDGRNVNDAFKKSLVVVAEMVAEATRFKFIQQYIEQNLINGFTPKGDVISYENAWEPLSEQIQKSGPDGIFQKPVQVQNADYSFKDITNVAQVKPDIGILLYKTTGQRLCEAKFGDVFTQDLIEELLPVL